MQLLNILTLLSLPFLASARFITEFQAYASPEQHVPEVSGVKSSAELYIAFQKDMKNVEWELRIFDAKKVTVSHLHCGYPGVRGPRVLNFIDNQEGEDYDGFVVQDIWNNDGVAQRSDYDFEADPLCGVPINSVATLYAAVIRGLIYFDFHTEANTSGEVRGQIWVGA